MNPQDPMRISALDFADAMGLFATIFGAPLNHHDITAILQPVDRGVFAPLARLAALHTAVEGVANIVHGLGEVTNATSRLNRDYGLLFLGMGGPGASPYESAYLGTGRLFQEPAAEMALLLRRCGWELAKDFSEAPDHLSVELSLLEEVLKRVSASGDPEAVTVADDLLARLRGWILKFEEACQICDGTGFYASAATLLRRLLDAGIDDPRFSPAH